MAKCLRRENMAGVVKWLTRRIVAPLRVGSSPTTRPIFFAWNPILSDFMGASPSGKATDFDSVIGGSTLPAPARKQEWAWRFFREENVFRLIFYVFHIDRFLCKKIIHALELMAEIENWVVLIVSFFHRMWYYKYNQYGKEPLPVRSPEENEGSQCTMRVIMAGMIYELPSAWGGVVKQRKIIYFLLESISFPARYLMQ